MYCKRLRMDDINISGAKQNYVLICIIILDKFVIVSSGMECPETYVIGHVHAWRASEQRCRNTLWRH